MNGDGRISYEEFLNSLREPLTGKRFEAVKRAFNHLDKLKAGHVLVEDLFQTFNVSQSEDFLSGKCTKEQLFDLCGFDTINKSGVVSWNDFLNLYTDISMGIDNNDYFVNMVEHTWDCCHESHCDVTKDHLKTLVATIRQKLLATSNRQSDEYVLRTIFSEFDTEKDGSLSAEQLDQMLIKLQIRCERPFLDQLIAQFDRNHNGVIEFEEFVHFIIHNPYK